MSGELDVAVTAEDLTDPAVIAWMTRFQEKVLADHGYREGARTCSAPRDPPELCPVVSLADLFRSGTPQSSQNVRALLDTVPRYFSQGAISADRKHRQPALRHPLHAARPPAGGDRRHQGARSTTRRSSGPKGVDAAGRRACRCWPPRRTPSSPSPWWRLGTLIGSLLLVFGVLWLLLGPRRRRAPACR